MQTCACARPREAVCCPSPCLQLSKPLRKGSVHTPLQGCEHEPAEMSWCGQPPRA